MMNKYDVLCLRDLALSHLPESKALSKKAYTEDHNSRAALQAVAWAPALLINSPLSSATEKLAGKLLALIGEHPETHNEWLVDTMPGDDGIGISVEDAIRWAEQERPQIEYMLIETTRELCRLTGTALPPWIDAAAPAGDTLPVIFGDKVDGFLAPLSSGKLHASMEDSDLAEVVRNGVPIEWRYWFAQSRITPAQAAKLTYCIDPIRWPSSDYAQGPIDNELRIKIAKLENALMGNADAYTLGELTAFLGDPFAPYNMEMAAIAQCEFSHVSPATAPVSSSDLSASPPNEEESGLLKVERQIRAIEAEALKAGYDLLNIRTGCKAELRKKCKALRPELFGAGNDPFNDAWKRAIGCNPPRLRMADHHKFAAR